MSTTPTQRIRPRFDVHVVRWIDGYRIEFTRRGLSFTEVHTLHVVEKILPGRLVHFQRSTSAPAWRTPART